MSDARHDDERHRSIAAQDDGDERDRAIKKETDAWLERHDPDREREAIRQFQKDKGRYEREHEDRIAAEAAEFEKGHKK